MIDLKEMRPSSKPNQYLVAPDGYCRHASTNRKSPEFDCPPGELMRRFMSVATAAPRVAVLEEDQAGHRVDLIQRSALLRFPDTITAEFIPLDDGRSTLAVYSRSRYGYSDFGVNKKRIEDWLATLQGTA